MNRRCTGPDPPRSLRTAHLVAVVQHALGTDQVDAQVVNAPVELGVGELPVAPFRAGDPPGELSAPAWSATRRTSAST